ncbi:MAG: hypothetical protein KI790_20120, partial [Cyclobacteriaceae bacterium]|nr:hypothetical protein [Cyclobacteriaceae bacterium HetDA_MAG_MS6]
IQLQYYRLNNGQEYIVVSDAKAKQIYLYDGNGRLVTGSPIEGSGKISLIYNQGQDEIQIYKTNGTILEIISLANT